MIKTTVQAAGLVGAGFLYGHGRNGWLCGGVPLTTGGHLAMVHFGMRARAEGAERSLEQADSGIRTMTKPPAASALGEADMFLGRGDDQAMLAIHKRFPDEVLHGETTVRVVDVEPHCPRVRGVRVPRKAGRVTFVKMDHTTEGRLHEDLVESRPWDREKTSMITSGGFQPVVREVADFEIRLRGGYLASQFSVQGLLHIGEEGLKDLKIGSIRDDGGLQG